MIAELGFNWELWVVNEETFDWKNTDTSVDIHVNEGAHTGMDSDKHTSAEDTTSIQEKPANQHRRGY